MITRRALTRSQFLPLVLVALALLVSTPMGASAASSEQVGSGVVVAIPGTVSLLVYLSAGAVLLSLLVARRRRTV